MTTKQDQQEATAPVPWEVTVSTTDTVDRAVTFTDADGDRHELMFHDGVFTAAAQIEGMWTYAALDPEHFGGYPQTDEEAVAFGARYAQEFRTFAEGFDLTRGELK